MNVGDVYTRSQALAALGLPDDPRHAVVHRHGTTALLLHDGIHLGWTNAIAEGVLWMTGNGADRSKNQILQQTEHEVHLLYKQDGPDGGYTYRGRVRFASFESTITQFQFRLLD